MLLELFLLLLFLLDPLIFLLQPLFLLLLLRFQPLVLEILFFLSLFLKLLILSIRQGFGLVFELILANFVRIDFLLCGSQFILGVCKFLLVVLIQFLVDVVEFILVVQVFLLLIVKLFLLISQFVLDLLIFVLKPLKGLLFLLFFGGQILFVFQLPDPICDFSVSLRQFVIGIIDSLLIIVDIIINDVVYDGSGS